jgi:hypothetical protein
MFFSAFSAPPREILFYSCLSGLDFHGQNGSFPAWLAFSPPRIAADPADALQNCHVCVYHPARADNAEQPNLLATENTEITEKAA